MQHGLIVRRQLLQSGEEKGSLVLLDALFDRVCDKGGRLRMEKAVDLV